MPPARGSGGRQRSSTLTLLVALGFSFGLLAGWLFGQGSRISTNVHIPVQETSHFAARRILPHEELNPTFTISFSPPSPSPPPPSSPPPPPPVKAPEPKLDPAQAAKLMAEQAAKRGAAGGSTLAPIAKRLNLPGDTIHTLYTSNGSPYQNFQGRIMYGTYKIVQKMPGGEKLTGFTRILHRQTPDPAYDEIPSFRADPLQKECDTWCEFPVKDRANAVMQWIMAVEKEPSMLKGAWLLMLESDYVWVKPLMAPGDAHDPAVAGLSFEYDYINPRWPGVTKILQEMCPTCEVDKIPASGPAPVLARFEDFKAATPDWEVWSAWIESHAHAKQSLGWVREMYAWSLAVAHQKLNIKNQSPKDTPLISQPPHDRSLNKACMYHYTWGVIYKNGSKDTWKWDKRFYTAADDALKIPQIPMPPAFVKGVRLQDGLDVTEELHNTLADMLQHMNAAIEQLPDIRQTAKVRTL